MRDIALELQRRAAVVPAALLIAVLPAIAAPRVLAGQVRPEDGVSAPVGEAPAPSPAVSAPQSISTRPTVRPTRTDNPPRIDGRLDDEIWRTAARLTEFVQQSPLDGAPATERTEVYVAYDSDYIYFGFYAHYQDPSIMRANRVDRDRAPQDDLLTIYFDTFQDQQRGYDFDVNAYGVQGDGIISAGAGGGGGIPRADRSWNTLFDTGAEIVEDGFTAEMAIPFKSLRYPRRAPGEEHRWGFQFVREVKSKNEENIVWAPMSRDQSSFFAQMGILEGMTDLSTSRNLEVMPTFTTIQYGAIQSPDGRYVNENLDPDAGVNLKYGLTSNLTADLTFNPDFSQIESDRTQIEVNQRFPILYPELRPFFVEGAEIFSIPAPVTIVHTRTIVDPDYGAKLTGKIGSASLGLVAANDRAPGKVDDPDDLAHGESATTFILRGRYDLYSESNVGAIFTDREFLDSHSRLAGVDGNFRLTGTTTMLVRAIGSWMRDLEGVDTDGHLLDVSMRRNGRSLDWAWFAYQISPEFDTDVGFVRRNDQRRGAANASYAFWPQSWIINWGPSVDYARNYDFDDVLQDEATSAGLSFSFSRSISLNLNARREMERFLGTEFEKTGFSVSGNVNSSRVFGFGGNFSMGEEVRYVAQPFLGNGRNWGVNATVRPIPSIESRLNVSSSSLTDPRNNDEEVFNVTVFRGQSTFQVTDRLSVRNITEYDTRSESLAFNLLFNYRINAGTVFYLGYDDHLRRGDRILFEDADGFDRQAYFTEDLRRTNRAVFLKVQYLLRY